MYSFCGPCFQFKVIAAVKLQYGYAGYASPFNKRYLTRTISFTVDDSNRGYATGYAGTTTETDAIDQHTGALTKTGDWRAVRSGTGDLSSFGMSPDYPFALISGSPSNNYSTSDSADITNWSIDGDTSMTIVKKDNITGAGGTSYTLCTLTVTLSNEYTEPMLETDADAIISSVDPSTMPWDSVVFGAASPYITGVFDYAPTGSMPLTFCYGITNAFSTPAVQSNRQAMAWSFYAYGQVSASQVYPNLLSKAMGIAQMVGKYSLTEYAGLWRIGSGGVYTYTLANAVCSDGNTLCGGTITINAPAGDHNAFHVVAINPGISCANMPINTGPTIITNTDTPISN